MPWGAGSGSLATVRQPMLSQRAPITRVQAPRTPRPRLCRVCVFSSEPSLVVLPVFPLPSAILPTEGGVLQAYEPRYRALFQALLEAHPASGRGARFIHVLSGDAAPPALLDLSAAGGVPGLPRIGCCARVESVQQEGGPEGPLVVAYAAERRVRLLGRAPAEEAPPYLVATAEWYDDERPGGGGREGGGGEGEEGPSPEALVVDALELEVAASLRRLEGLAGGGAAALPAAVWRYAPPPPARCTSYDALKGAGHRAAAAIDTWRRHGSVYGSAPRPAARTTSDPYQVAREEVLGKGRRQELFSFAAAQLLELGAAPRCALLLSTDTGGRLQYVLSALRPYVRELEARASLRGVLGREAA